MNDTFVALLRGINVGGRNKIPMADLRSLCTGLGWADVRSYIQSGNLVFRAKGQPDQLEADLEREIEERFGFAIPAIVRTASDWMGYMDANPFPRAARSDPNWVLLIVPRDHPHEEAAEILQAKGQGGERVVQTGDVLWIHYASGIGRSRLTPALLDRMIGSSSTGRNWRTVLRIGEMIRRN